MDRVFVANLLETGTRLQVVPFRAGTADFRGAEVRCDCTHACRSADCFRLAYPGSRIVPAVLSRSVPPYTGVRRTESCRGCRVRPREVIAPGNRPGRTVFYAADSFRVGNMGNERHLRNDSLAAAGQRKRQGRLVPGHLPRICPADGRLPDPAGDGQGVRCGTRPRSACRTCCPWPGGR